ncbi:glucose 1-dehydrogenase [Clostridium sp. 19966]|uniref:SDR family oxidoreductase n=1 Tax=Clostridium sp. 19966 TaxID=2768166 RepID=UPI0028E01582|nr:SDR family oxidoreductase [Clostridium sp. 19966]MDT8716758.1 glucose 1-dehydrogenase [Clostridium sp. 19966]
MSNSFPGENFPKGFPLQKQDSEPGIESVMKPKPIFEDPEYGVTDGKLKGKVAIITGGDSGIGRAVAVAFAKEGADIVIVYLNEDSDANETKNFVDKKCKKCTLIKGDIGDEQFCIDVVNKTMQEFGRIDIVVNNAAEQHPAKALEDITAEQLEKTFKTNVFAMFYLTKAALFHMKAGASIINTSSITAFKGSQDLLDYSSTKGAISAFTRSLSTNLASRNIRVNAVAPGPIWTPLIPSTFQAEDSAKFGADTPLGRAGQPVEVAGAYVYLASADASYVTGQTIHVNGGTIING